MRQSTICWAMIVGLGLLLLAGGAEAKPQTLEERVRVLEEQSAEKASTFELPSWLKIFTFKGDLRLRYQFEDETGDTGRHRGRFRYRLSIGAEVIEGLKVGFGIASGGDDPRSTNQTFQDTFSSKSIRIDLAFAEYKPVAWLSIMAGKFKNPLWTPSDLLWDSDIRPEGVSVVIDRKVAPGVSVFFGTGLFVLDEISGGSDPLMLPFQGGVKIHLAKQVVLRLAATYYEFVDVQGKRLDFSAGTNTLRGDVLAFDYDAVNVSAELGFVELFGPVLPYIGVFGEYVHSFDPSNDNNGFLGGVSIGHRKISATGHWQLKYMYRRLERDAWPDALPDSDFFGGGTNAQGHEVILVVGIVKHVSAGIDYYHTEEIDSNTEQDVFQFDVVFKF